MKVQQLRGPEALARLRGRPDGLTSAEAARRLGSTAPLPARVWVFMAPFALLMLAQEEARR
jgi:hypothetical protein